MSDASTPEDAKRQVVAESLRVLIIEPALITRAAPSFRSKDSCMSADVTSAGPKAELGAGLALRQDDLIRVDWACLSTQKTFSMHQSALWPKDFFAWW